MARMGLHSRTDWRLVFRAAPLAALAVLAKFAVDQVGWDTIALNPLYSGLVAANVFLLGFLLAGTLADYKESEKLPGELAVRTEAIADECQILVADKGAEPARACLEHLARLAETLNAWLRGREEVEAPLERIEELNHYFLAFEPLTQPNFIVRLKQEQSALRLLVTRINTIKGTSFVGAGYVIAEITSALLIVALVVADIAPLGAELFLLGMIAFLLAYMILLIRDIDDPFDYDENGRRGAAEVSLAPLDYLARRMASEAQSPEAPLLAGSGGRSGTEG
jgi:predicted membrane chloride channel (bestrophin family)